MKSILSKLLRRGWLCIALVLLVGVICGLLREQYIEERTVEMLGEPSAELQGVIRRRTLHSVYTSLNEILQPFDLNGASQLITVNENDSAAQIAQDLLDKGLIGNEELFIRYLVYSGADTRLMPGRYALSAAMNMPELVEKLSMHGGKLLTFAFFSGMRLEEIAALISDSGLSFSADDFLYAAQHYPAQLHPWGGTSLEGCMLPGTYEMNRDISLDRFLEGFVNAFVKSVKEPLESSYNANGLSLEQGVIMASLIAREAPSEEEYARIASVFYNRIRAGMRFESDPTAQYAIGWDEVSHSWWKSPLQSSDLYVSSPYNTYQRDGFPPGPICSPSLAVLRAVAQPENTPYLFFMARCDGTPLHDFSQTYAEHAGKICR